MSRVSRRKPSTQGIVKATIVVALLSSLYWPFGVRAQSERRPENNREEISGRSKAITRIAVVKFGDLAQKNSAAGDALAAWNPELEPESITHDLPVPPDVALPNDAPLKTSLTSANQTGALTSSPTPTASFRALPDANVAFPPDTNGAVGANHVMTTLNDQIRVQSRTGLTIKTVAEANFWAPLGHSDLYDPKVLYDPFANRWMFTMLADRNSASSSVLMAVSQTSDPTGYWNLFSIVADPSSVLYADFPSMGFNKDWIVVQVNMYSVGSGTPNSSEVLVFNKASLYAGTTGSYKIFPLAPSFGGTQAPALTYDNSISTEYLLQDWNGNSGGNGFLRIYAITGPVGSETLTATGLFPGTSNPWTYQPSAGYASDFAPQLGSTRKIHTLDSRMRNVVYRNGSLWTTHTVYLPAATPTRCSVQWWQIDPGSGSALQVGRIDDPSGANFYAVPSIAVNKNNDFLLGYSRFSATQYASANYAFHAATDAAGTVETDTVLKAGEGPYAKSSTFGISGANRWGDSSNTVVDPANDLNLWTLQEYAGAANTWSTWWGNIAPPAGTATPSAPTSLLATAGSSVVSLSWNASAGAISYNVKRAQVSGGPYVTIASGITTTVYGDSGLTNGATYYYVVSAINANGESANSIQASATPVAPAAFAVRINAGGPRYVDSLGNTWMADTYFQNGSAYAPASLNTTNIQNTADPVLYRSERFGGPPGTTPLAYAIPVANGTYTVRLLFAETWFGVATGGGVGSRVFDVSLENTVVLPSFDIYATAGGPLKAVVEQFTVTVNDGVLNISAAGNYPKFNAIEVLR